jgi:hypothetical protein
MFYSTVVIKMILFAFVCLNCNDLIVMQEMEKVKVLTFSRERNTAHQLWEFMLCWDRT